MATVNTKNITVDAVKGALGENNWNVGSLCKSSKINRFSKYKPVPLSDLFVYSVGSTVSMENPISGGTEYVPWWWGIVKTGTDSNGYSYLQVCGLKVPLINGISTETPRTIIDNYSTNGMNWQYVGVGSYPYRLTDFGGYDHNAGSPFAAYALTPVYKSTDYFNFTVEIVSEYGTQIDITPFSHYLGEDWVPAVILVHSNGNTYTMLKGDEDLASMGKIGGVCNWSQTAQNTEYDTYKCYFVLVSEAKNQMICLPSSTDYPNPTTVEVTTGIGPSSVLRYIVWDTVSYGYSQSGWFEPICNAVEQKQVTLCTTSPIVYNATISPIKEVTLDFSKVTLTWGGQTLSNWALLINGTSKTKGSYTFSDKITVTMVISDLYSGTSPTSGTNYKTDPIIVNYGTEGQMGQMDCNVTYDSTHEGSFYSASDGYFTKR